MTFRSLHRLERRGLLRCPIVGVAVNDWSVEQLRERARESIVGSGEQLDSEAFDRFAARLSYVPGDFGDPSTYDRVEGAIAGARSPVFYLEIPPFLFGTVVKNLAEVGLTKTARVVVGEAVRPRPRREGREDKLDEYAAGSRAEAMHVVALAHRLTRLATAPPAIRPLRNLALRLLALVPPFRRSLAEQLSAIGHP